MSALDATRLIDSRFAENERRIQENHEDQEALSTEFAVLKHEVTAMVNAFKSFKNALYTCAAAVMAAAILVVVLGHHP